MQELLSPSLHIPCKAFNLTKHLERTGHREFLRGELDGKIFSLNLHQYFELSSLIYAELKPQLIPKKILVFEAKNDLLCFLLLGMSFFQRDLTLWPLQKWHAQAETALEGQEYFLLQNETLLSKLRLKAHRQLHKLGKHFQVPLMDSNIPLARPFLKLLSSGSTGCPKVFTFTLKNILFSAKAHQLHFKLTPEHSLLTSLPLFHVAGLMNFYRALVSGASLTLVTPKDPLPSKALRQASPQKRWRASLVPPQVEKLLSREAGSSFLKSLDHILVGGEPLKKEFIHHCRAHKLALHMSYGLTEALSTVMSVDLKKESSLDLPLPPLPFLKVCLTPQGTLTIRGPQVLGKDPITTQDVFKKVSNQRKTYLRFIKRADSVFICAGENIYPNDIAFELEKNPFVKKAWVIPMRHPSLGLAPWALIHLDSKYKPTRWSEDLKARLKKSLSPYQIPKKIIEVPPQYFDHREQVKMSFSELQDLARQISD